MRHLSNDTRPTRRDLLKTLTLILAPALPATRPGAQAPSHVMNALSTYMSGAATRELPAEVVEHARQHIADTFAAMISGSELPHGPAAIPFSQAHPGCAVVPAALAAGEAFGVDGTRFLRAVTLGYDVGTRVVMAMGGVTFRSESHRSTHSIPGIFGAGAAAACTAGLDARQMRWMLDYTAQQSSGIAAWQRDTDHIEKAFVFGGMSARGGVTSALVVQSGWNGVDYIFSGADNFFLAYAPAADPNLLVDQLGARYEITRTDIKKWTGGSPIQGPLEPLA